jgi:single-strand DNA-binding protein
MNKVILMGRLTKDPELRYTSANNTALCSFSLAVDRRFTKPGEEKQADFFNVTAWEKQAEFCGKYFTKGLKVVIVGRLQNRTWDDNEGKKHYATDVVAEECHFAESRKSEGGAPSYRPSGASGTSGSASSSGGGQPDGGGFYPMDEDDELPF